MSIAGVMRLTPEQAIWIEAEHAHVSWRVRAVDFILCRLHYMFAGKKSDEYKSIIPDREIEIAAPVSAEVRMERKAEREAATQSALQEAFTRRAQKLRDAGKDTLI